jgi:hypothetical protein
MKHTTEGTASDPTPGESMATAFSSSNHDAEPEAMTVLGLLQSNGIPAIYVGPHMLPNLGFQVQVPAHLLAEAERVIAEASLAGQDAADRAEAAEEAGN